MLVDNLILKKSLGKGSFGEVFLTKKVNGTEYYATKRMNREEYNRPDNYKRLINEISILQKLNHENIVKYIETKKTKSHIYIVTEYCNGGSLSSLLSNYMKKNKKPFTEEIVQYLMRQLVSAINYLHKNKIIHRDLKLDNILVHFPTEQDKINSNILSAKVKIIDFGFATKLKSSHQDLTNTILGTPSNMDPKMLRNMELRQHSQEGYNESVDIWSLGTLCYEMITGKLTFFGRNMNELYEKVKLGNYKLPLWLSKEAVSFLNGMLQYDEKKRYSSDDLMKHDFLNKNVKYFQPIETEKIKNKIQGSNIKVNIKNNDTIFGIFNNEKQDINLNKPLTEEDNIKNAAVTFPNFNPSEKIMNQFDNKKETNKAEFTSFAKVQVIPNFSNNNNINNKGIPSGMRHTTKNKEIVPINKPSNIPQTANPSSNHNYRQHNNYQNNMNQMNNQINQIKNDINNINLGQQNKPQKYENKMQLRKQFTVPNNNGQKESFNYIFNEQKNLPSMSKMETYCKEKTKVLNEFY